MKTTGCLYLLIILFTFASYSLEAQKMRISSSTISFFSDGLLEDIAAVNTASQAILNLADGAFVLRIPITSFEFPNQLMQEHFNENYLESEKFPQGELMIHGITQERTLVIDISDEKKGIKVKGKFDVALEDHDVEIPSLLFQKIAEIVAVDIEIHLTELKL